MIWDLDNRSRLRKLISMCLREMERLNRERLDCPDPAKKQEYWNRRLMVQERYKKLCKAHRRTTTELNRLTKSKHGKRFYKRPITNYEGS